MNLVAQKDVILEGLETLLFPADSKKEPSFSSKKMKKTPSFLSRTSKRQPYKKKAGSLFHSCVRGRGSRVAGFAKSALGGRT